MSNVETSLYMLVGLVLGVIFHEFFHGYVAWKLGDPTPKAAGRVTLDPLAHVDPFGTLILPGLLFLMSLMGYGGFIIGYAKPVPVNPFLLRKARYIVYVSLAGPLSNLMLGISCMGLAGAANAWWGGVAGDKAAITLVFIAYINFLLFVFNLLPIPPLDGSRVVGYFLKGEARRAYQAIEPYGIIIILLIVSFFGFPLGGLVRGLLNLCFRLFQLPYTL